MNDENTNNTPVHSYAQSHQPNPIAASSGAGSPPVAGTPALAAPSKDELLDIKQDALKSLAPMVNQLDQSPEEKFKTLMMLIQASDNATLVKDAYSAAQHIQDEKERAQALIDIVNEINYFTQNH